MLLIWTPQLIYYIKLDLCFYSRLQSLEELLKAFMPELG